MTPERWQKVKEVFQDARQYSSGPRAAFLAAACADDEDLRREVESLLAADNQSGSFMDRPAAVAAVDHFATKRVEYIPGSTVGSYQIERQIGQGGMGVIYLARDTRLGRPVALKLLQPHLTKDPQRLHRFRQEARAVSALNHPNILTIYETGEVGGVSFIATEFIDGLTVRGLMAAGQRTIGATIDIVLQVADALAAAHEAGVVHRDIKPENIMVRPDGYVKVLDFGLAKLNERTYETRSDERFSAVETNPGVVMGTFNYMSPEQARGIEVDARTDIFSLGVVLYELITGHEPFSGPTSSDVIAALLHAEPPPLVRFSPETPAELQRIIDRALAKDVEARYPSITEMAADLKALEQELEVGASIERAKRKTSSVRGLTNGARGLIIGVALVSILFLAAYLIRRSPPASSIRSVAVLPFKPLVANQSDEVLEMGIADTLITRLSSLKQVSLPPVSAVRRYRSLDQDPLAAGRELNVQAVLESSIQRADNRIRVTVRLLDVTDGKPLWTRQFDEPWTDIFAVQDAISQRVASDLMLTLSGEERGELARNYTTNPEAYDLYMKGRHYWNKRSPDGMLLSIESYKKAIEKDPQYALAYVGLADAYATIGSYRVAPPRESLPLAQEAALRALKIDERLAEAHASLGKIYADYEWDWDRAEKEFKLAIELKPNYANAHHWYSMLLANLGRSDDAIREARRAVDLDYFAPATTTQLGNVLYRARRYDEAITVLRKTLDLEPNFVAARVYLGLCYMLQGKHAEAISEMRKGKEAAPGHPGIVSTLGLVYGAAGQSEQARQCLKELNEIAQQRYVAAFNYAGIYSGLGEMELTMKWLKKAYEDRDPSIRGFKFDPVFDPVRQDPRFIAWTREVGLAQ
jgi:serine/threonine protein kinase/tetratricopeptide (TPR) repeat protein